MGQAGVHGVMVHAGGQGVRGQAGGHMVGGRLGVRGSGARQGINQGSWADGPGRGPRGHEADRAMWGRGMGGGANWEAGGLCACVWGRPGGRDGGQVGI